jgi:hypothetical protein
MKICKYCHLEQPEEAFEVCRVINGKIYRRLKCQKCKRAGMYIRRSNLRKWLDEYKQELVCERCGFADYRALEFHHKNHNDKHYNVADMIRSGLSILTIKREIGKCIVLCSNCHQIEHYYVPS